MASRPGMRPSKVRKLASVEGYWFLGQPYTFFPDGQEASYIHAVKAQDRLAELGIEVYSPIAEMHGAVAICDRHALDGVLWLKRARWKRDRAYGLIVFKLPGWDLSGGLFQEQREFTQDKKPIEYLEPEELA